MRILHVVEAVGTGTANHIKMLVAAQRASGDEVFVAAPARRARGVSDDDFLDVVRRSGAQVEQVQLHSLPLHPRNVRAARELRRVIATWQPDVVHSHSTAAGAVARPVARFLHTPAVHTPHGVRFADRATGPYAASTLALERLLSRVTERVIALSASEAVVLRRAYAQRQIEVVPNGVLLPTSTVPMPVQPTIVFVARLTQQKDPETAVRIMAAVRRARPKVHAVIVGDGPRAQRLRWMIERLDRDIRLVNSGMTGAAAISGASVILVTSRWEGGPYVPLEAMAHGRPVVASDVVGCRDVVVHGQTGFLFELGRPDLAVQEILELVDDPATISAMGRAGRRRVALHYRLDTSVERTRALYGSVAAGAQDAHLN